MLHLILNGNQFNGSEGHERHGMTVAGTMVWKREMITGLVYLWECTGGHKNLRLSRQCGNGRSFYAAPGAPMPVTLS